MPTEVAIRIHEPRSRDIVAVHGPDSIARKNLQDRICHRKFAGFTEEGLRPDNSLSRMWYDCVYQYRFERVSRYEVIRTETDYLGRVVSEERFKRKWGLYVRHALLHPRHRIFGVSGNEVWHGGLLDLRPEVLRHVWEKVQEHSGHRNSEDCPVCGEHHTMYPRGRLDIRHFAIVRMDEELTYEECYQLTEPYWERRNDKQVWRHIETGEEFIGDEPPPGPMEERQKWDQSRLAKHARRAKQLEPFRVHLQVTLEKLMDRSWPVGLEVNVVAGRMSYAKRELLRDRLQTLVEVKPIRRP